MSLNIASAQQGTPSGRAAMAATLLGSTGGIRGSHASQGPLRSRAEQDEEEESTPQGSERTGAEPRLWVF
ncbi:hypothetical protein GCM10027075_47290 [Streptomyces heilongjiangensis]